MATTALITTSTDLPSLPGIDLTKIIWTKTVAEDPIYAENKIPSKKDPKQFNVVRSMTRGRVWTGRGVLTNSGSVDFDSRGLVQVYVRLEEAAVSSKGNMPAWLKYTINWVVPSSSTDANGKVSYATAYRDDRTFTIFTKDSLDMNVAAADANMRAISIAMAGNTDLLKNALLGSVSGFGTS